MSTQMIWRLWIVLGIGLAACSSASVELTAAELSEAEMADATSDSVSASTFDSGPQEVEPLEVSPDEPLEHPSLVGGMATMFRPVSFDEARSGEEFDLGPDGELGLEGCRWRSPGLYSFDMSWTPFGDVDWPVTIFVSQGILRGDVGTGWGGFVTLEGPGDFSIPHDVYATENRFYQESEDRIGVAANRRTVLNEQGVRCLLEDSVPVELDPLPVEQGPEGTIEQLVSQMEAESPLLPLAVFVPQAGQLEIDRLFIGTTGSLESINASLRSDCLSIRSWYLIEPELELLVEQTLRCPDENQSEPGETMVIADDVWRVTVTGPAQVVDGFALGIEDLSFAGVARLGDAAGSFDAAVALEAAIVGSGFTEIVRVPWDGGLVAIGFYNFEFAVERYADPIVAVPERFNGGGGGTGCEDYSITVQGDSTRGFSFVVVEDANHSVVQIVGGEQVMLPAIPAADGRAVVFLDNVENRDIVAMSLSILDETGETIPCVQ